MKNISLIVRTAYFTATSFLFFISLCAWIYPQNVFLSIGIGATIATIFAGISLSIRSYTNQNIDEYFQARDVPSRLREQYIQRCSTKMEYTMLASVLAGAAAFCIPFFVSHTPLIFTLFFTSALILTLTLVSAWHCQFSAYDEIDPATVAIYRIEQNRTFAMTAARSNMLPPEVFAHIGSFAGFKPPPDSVLKALEAAQPNAQEAAVNRP